MNNGKLRVSLATLGAGLVLTSASAMAGITWYDPVTLFEDNNLDWFENVEGDTNIMDIGDRLITVFQIDSTVNGSQTESAPITGGELTGIVAIEVTNKVATGFIDPVTLLPTFLFTFGAVSNGLDTYLPTDLAGGLGDAGDGAAVAAYFDTTPNLGAPPICADLNACLAAAGDGDLWEVDTFDATPDGGATVWSATGADDIGGMNALPGVIKVAVANFILNIAVNGTGQDLGPQIIGSADILGGSGLTNGAFARSDTDFQKSVSIPEPGTLMLLSVGLLGLGAAKRRRAVRS